MASDDVHLSEVPTPYGPVQVVRVERPGCPRLSFLFPDGMPDDMVMMFRAKLEGIARASGGRVVEPID